MYYGYVYKITIPTSNGDRYYYGKHKWSKYPQIDTHYWGSGRKISNWIKKHFGINKRSNSLNIMQAEKIGLKQEVIVWCKTQKELDQKEYEIVSKEIKSPLCWNLDRGGKGGNREKPFSSECIAARNKKYKNALGRKRWNNGKTEIMTKECPGDGWVLGRLPGVMCQWYNDGKKDLYCKGNPGDGWFRGRLNKSVKRTRVRCIETNIIFDSLYDAAKFYSGSKASRGHIRECCIGKREKCLGFHWEFVDKDKIRETKGKKYT